MAYVAAVDEIQRRSKEYDARIRVIFDNGMESNHLLRSFARVLYDDENGRQIVEVAPTVSGPLFGGIGHVSGPLFTGEAERAQFGEVKGTVYIVEAFPKILVSPHSRGAYTRSGSRLCPSKNGSPTPRGSNFPLLIGSSPGDL
jgi:hypothetical protein